MVGDKMVQPLFWTFIWSTQKYPKIIKLTLIQFSIFISKHSLFFLHSLTFVIAASDPHPDHLRHFQEKIPI